jgi:hypothetical protein
LAKGVVRREQVRPGRGAVPSGNCSEAPARGVKLTLAIEAEALIGLQ